MPALPSLFVAEGLFDALTLEAAAAVCSAMRARAGPGSALVASFSISPEGSELTRALRSATGVVRQATDERRRNEFRPGDPQKLLVVTGWRVTHTESTANAASTRAPTCSWSSASRTRDEGADRRPLLSRAQESAPAGATAPPGGPRHRGRSRLAPARRGPPPRSRGR